MLDREYSFYNKNKKKLLLKYKNSVLVIVGEEIVGVYNDEMEAYEEAIKQFGLGKFLIQRCVDDEVTVQTFHSRVILPR